MLKSHLRTVRRLHHAVLAASGVLLLSPPNAAPLMHDIFQDHVVLQRDRSINVWGRAAPHWGD